MFVDVTPPPMFAGLDRSDYRVIRMVEMLRGVAVFRVVTAADMAADQTFAQMHPRIAHLQAFFAAVGRRLYVANLREVRARFYLHSASQDRPHHAAVSKTPKRALA
jgi:hypothetical protein